MLLLYLLLVSANANPTINNMQVVKNADEPVIISPTITLTRVWKKGGEDPGFIINNPQALDVDDSGRIYLLDILESDVKVFSSEGNYLFSFGREGQGPGEFHIPKSLIILPQQKQILIIDNSYLRRFNFFTLKGNFLRSFRDTLLYQSQSYSKRSVAALSSRRKVYSAYSYGRHSFLLLTRNLVELTTQVNEIWWYDSNLNAKAKIVSITHPDPVMLNTSPMNEQMEVEPQFSVDRTGLIYVLKDNYKYHIQVYDSTGQIIRTIQRNFTLPRKSVKEFQRDQKRAREETTQLSALGKKIKVEPLREKPIIYGPHTLTRSIFTDKKGRLWVLTNESYPQKKSKSLLDDINNLFQTNTEQPKVSQTKFSFDVFNHEGKYLMKIPFQAEQPRCFRYKEGFLYFVDLGKYGFPWLFKCRITEHN